MTPQLKCLYKYCYGTGDMNDEDTDKYACFHCGTEFHFDCASECTVTCDGKCENAFCHECKFYIIIYFNR